MTTIPLHIRLFLRSSVRSIPYLEAAMLIRQQPDIAHTVADVAAKLYVVEELAARLLDELHDSGIVHRSDGSGSLTYRYAPAASLRRTLDEVAAWYALDLVAITDVVHDATQTLRRGPSESDE
jgi:hypothetical protein